MVRKPEVGDIVVHTMSTRNGTPTFVGVVWEIYNGNLDVEDTYGVKWWWAQDGGTYQNGNTLQMTIQSLEILGHISDLTDEDAAVTVYP